MTTRREDRALRVVDEVSVHVEPIVVEERVHARVDGLRVQVRRLRLEIDLDPADEVCRPLGGENAARPAVEDAKPERDVARRLARTVEAVVLLVVLALEPGSPLAKQRSQPSMVLSTTDSELELAFDAAITWAVVNSAPGHAWRLREVTPRLVC